MAFNVSAGNMKKLFVVAAILCVMGKWYFIFQDDHCPSQ